MIHFSECIGVCACEELAACGLVVADNHDHFVELWAHLDAASETTVGGLSGIVAEHTGLLE